MPPTPLPSPSPLVVQLIDASEGTPWWGAGVLAGIFLILGAALGFLTTFVSDTRRAKREQRQRFHGELLATSSALLLRADEFERQVTSLTVLFRSEPHVLQRQSTQAQIAKARSHLLDAGEGFMASEASLRLIAPDNVREALEALGIQVGALSVLAMDESSKLGDAAARLTTLSAQFQDAVRFTLAGPAR